MMGTVKIVHIPLTVKGPRGVSAYLVCGTSPIIVDAGIPGSAPEILAVLESNGYTPEEVSMIVVTHAHIDHAGDALILKQRTGAPVVAHVYDADAIERGISAPVKGRTPEAQAMLDSMSDAMTPYFPGVEVDIRVEDEYSLDSAGVPARLIHTPGHTAGSITLVTADGEAIVGDLIGGNFTDPTRAEPGPFAIDPDAMTASIRRVLSLGLTKIYCGHDGPFEADGLAGLREL